MDRCRFHWVSMLVAASVGLLGGCSSGSPTRAPDVVLDDVHSGGNVVAIAADGARFASGGWEGRIRVYSLPDASQSARWQAHRGAVNGLAFVAGGERMISVGYDGRLAEWSRRGAPLRSRDLGMPIMAMTVDERGDRLVTGHGDGSVSLWRLSDWRMLETRRVHARAVRAVAFHGPTGSVASSGRDGTVVTWRPGRALRRLQAPPSDVWSLVFSTDGARLFGGGWFHLFRWRLSDATLTVLDTAHRGIIKALGWTPDGRALASISRQTDSAVLFLDPATGATMTRFRRHDLCGADVEVSRDGRYVVTTSDDASVRVWWLEN